MAARVMGAKATALYLLDESSGKLALRATHNVSPTRHKSDVLEVGQGIAGQVAEKGQPIYVPDVQNDPGFYDHELAVEEGWVSLLAAPLMVRERIVGVFSCYSGRYHKFSTKEMELFQTLANQTALAIENARLVINTAVVREMHHRVKNNLQTIAMLLRLQMSAAHELRADEILPETINRILSIAAVHETLSEGGLRVVDLKDVLRRVTASIGETMLGGMQDISIQVSGDRLILPSREATSLALATGELVQNALKHAFVGRERGRIQIELRLGGDESQISVEDDGIGNLGEPGGGTGLGLQIVEALVVEDLKGHFELSALAEGTRAVLRFPSPAHAGVKS
jgi:two-component sensor histidine kinase